MQNETSKSFEINTSTAADGSNQSTSFQIRKAVQKNGVRAISEALDRLIDTRKSWEQTELARSNQRLYSILQECYEIYQQMNGTDSIAKGCKTIFNSYCETAGYTFKSSTSLMNKIVRCVFGDCNGDRQRVSAYAQALKVAAEAKTLAKDIPTYIAKEGGVEQMRRKKSDQTASKVSRVDIGKAALDKDVIARVKSDELDKVFDAAEYYDSVLMLATREPDGSFAVRKLIQNNSVIEKAFASLAPEINKEAKAKAPENRAAYDLQQREAAITEAIAA